jgi:hypothetical protein
MMIEKKVHIKWIGPNDPMVRLGRNDARLYLTKRELFELGKEIKGFINFYPGDFSDTRIDIETPAEDFSMWATDYNKKESTE